ncbi:PHAF1 protein-like isoform X2 [Salvia divinorum]|uniref:PHAF1 protein-like isoform X2 n=1 Tax=Salvia divinorum TaxID=28513 RepID=A0ABD1G0Z7_SALDI
MQRNKPRCESTAMASTIPSFSPNIYHVDHVKSYDDEPLKFDIVISFRDYGFHLTFNPWSQGLSFLFLMPSQYAQCCHDREASTGIYRQNNPVTCRISVYDSSTDRKVGVGSSIIKLCVPSLAAGSLYMEEVVVVKVN